MSKLLKRAAAWGVAIALVAIVTPANAEPFRATNPDLVILTIPAHGEQSRLATLERLYREEPASMGKALDLSEAQIARGRQTADARGFGRAEAILEQWRARAATSARWHVLRADIFQYRHDYDKAIALLDRALAIDPAERRAHLMRAAIFQTGGDFRRAEEDCRALLARGETAIGLVCLSEIKGLTGQLDRSYELLARQVAADGGRTTDVAIRVWMLTALADMADRRGDAREAEGLLRSALALDPGNLFVHFTLADLLLTEKRADEVPGLLENLPSTQGVLLRIAEAESATRASSNDGLIRLRQAVMEARARGERIDGRDLTRLQLLEHDGCGALEAARANWSVQREPTDVRLLIDAARSCGDPDALSDLLSWRMGNGYEDARADAMLLHLGRAM